MPAVNLWTQGVSQYLRPLAIACLHDDGFSFSQIHQSPEAIFREDFYNLVFTFSRVWSDAVLRPYLSLDLLWGKE